MNQLTIIGNLTRDPEMRSTSTGKSVCSFTVAVNRRKQQNGKQEADFFNVSAWNEMGENCGKYLAKGRKVCVVGSVSLKTYTSQTDGKTHANIDVTAREVEFLSPKSEGNSQQAETAPAPNNGFTPVDMSDDELPF